MSKIANAYKMYLMLRGRNVVSVKELAERLEVAPRMIKAYKRELVNAGIPIETKAGRYGGYYLKIDGHLPVPLSYNEKSTIDLALSFLEQNQFVYYPTFERIIREYIRIGEINRDIYMLKYQHDTDDIIKKRQKYFPVIGMAIRERQKLCIDYRSLSSRQRSERTIWPLRLFEFMDTTYIAAYCEKQQGIRFFKISRINDLSVLHSYFKTDKGADIKRMLQESYGIFTGKVIDVELLISHPFNEIVQEKVIANNQQITVVDKDTIRFKASMSGGIEIENWILSMGEHVTVVGDQSLKQSVAARIKKMYTRIQD